MKRIKNLRFDWADDLIYLNMTIFSGIFPSYHEHVRVYICLGRQGRHLNELHDHLLFFDTLSLLNSSTVQQIRTINNKTKKY